MGLSSERSCIPWGWLPMSELGSILGQRSWLDHHPNINLSSRTCSSLLRCDGASAIAHVGFSCAFPGSWCAPWASWIPKPPCVTCTNFRGKERDFQALRPQSKPRCLRHPMVLFCALQALPDPSLELEMVSWVTQHSLLGRDTGSLLPPG